MSDPRTLVEIIAALFAVILAMWACALGYDRGYVRGKRFGRLEGFAEGHWDRFNRHPERHLAPLDLTSQGVSVLSEAVSALSATTSVVPPERDFRRHDPLPTHLITVLPDCEANG